MKKCGNNRRIFPFPLVNGRGFCYTEPIKSFTSGKKNRNMKQKRTVSLALCAALLASTLLAGCGGKSTQLNPKEPVNLTI